jgi:hypothetical protein
MNIPAKYPDLFWDVDPDSIGAEHETFVIERILEHGTLESIKDLHKQFPRKTIENVVKTSRRISRRTGLYWQTYYNIKEPLTCLNKASLNPLSEPWS